MSETFELHILDKDQTQRRVFVACPPEDIVRIARLRMVQHGAAAVQVWRSGEHLATLEPPETTRALAG